MMTEPEAERTRSKILDHAEHVCTHTKLAGELLLEFRNREGWKALKGKSYTGFKECCEAEFAERFGSRSNIYLLMTQAEVTRNIGATDPVPASHAAALSRLPAEKQAEVYEKVLDKKPEATEEDVKKAVERAVPAPKEDKVKRKEKIDEIAKVCGKVVKTALEEETIELDLPNLRFVAALPEPTMKSVMDLVVKHRWMPRKAHKFLDEMPDDNSTAADLINYAIAAGGEWDGTINGFDFTIRKKDKR